MSEDTELILEIKNKLKGMGLLINGLNEYDTLNDVFYYHWYFNDKEIPAISYFKILDHDIEFELCEINNEPHVTKIAISSERGFAGFDLIAWLKGILNIIETGITEKAEEKIN